MEFGSNNILMVLFALVGLGAVLLLTGAYARRTGRLQSRGARWGVVGLVGFIAFLVWIGPALFLASDQ